MPRFGGANSFSAFQETCHGPHRLQLTTAHRCQQADSTARALAAAQQNILPVFDNAPPKALTTANRFCDRKLQQLRFFRMLVRARSACVRKSFCRVASLRSGAAS